MNPYRVKVEVAELLGHEYYIHTTFGAGDLVAKIPLVKEIKIGEDLDILVNVKKSHIFDPITEKRIY